MASTHPKHRRLDDDLRKPWLCTGCWTQHLPADCTIRMQLCYACECLEEKREEDRAYTRQLIDDMPAQLQLEVQELRDSVATLEDDMVDREWAHETERRMEEFAARADVSDLEERVRDLVNHSMHTQDDVSDLYRKVAALEERLAALEKR